MLNLKCIGFFLMIIIFAACQKTANDQEMLVSQVDEKINPNNLIVQRNLLQKKPNQGLVFYQDQPFSGTSIQHYPNQVKGVLIQYHKGKKQGLFQKWFPNRDLSFEAHYVNGKQDGITKSWWKNKQLRSESFFKNGVGEGTQKQWYKSGQLFKAIHLVNGKEEGLQQAWRENGKVYNNYEAKNGRIFGLKRANLCYQLEDEAVQYKVNDEK